MGAMLKVSAGSVISERGNDPFGSLKKEIPGLTGWHPPGKLNRSEVIIWLFSRSVNPEGYSMSFEFHPYANIFPMISGAAFDELKADIAAHGVREPVWLYEGKILDGRNRYRAAQIVGVTTETKEYTGTDPLAFVVSLNLHRRHLTESQRAMVAANMANLDRGDSRNAGNNCKFAVDSPTRAKAAELLNVSERSVNTAKAVQRTADESLSSAITDGTVSLHSAAAIATLPKEEQKEVVAKGEKEILAKAKEIRAERSKEKKAQNEELKKNTPPPAFSGSYSVLVIDPPWPMEKIERDVRPNQVALDYPTMSEEEMSEMALPFADDAHVFMWTTHKFLPMAFRLFDAWGVKYVCNFVWHKPGGPQPFNLPQYNCEFCLYGRIGVPTFVDTKAFNTCFQAPRGAHSEKPEEFYDLIRRVTDGYRIDIFNRRAIAGFDVWGNESGEKLAG